MMVRRGIHIPSLYVILREIPFHQSAIILRHARSRKIEASGDCGVSSASRPVENETCRTKVPFNHDPLLDYSAKPRKHLHLGPSPSHRHAKPSRTNKQSKVKAHADAKKETPRNTACNNGYAPIGTRASSYSVARRSLLRIRSRFPCITELCFYSHKRYILEGAHGPNPPSQTSVERSP